MNKPRSVFAYARRLFLEGIFLLVAALVFLVSRGQWRAWKRNSLALGYWSERSDLDLTLFSRSAAPLSPAMRALWRIFRRFGEWAAYTGANAGFAPLANPLELARDPKLARLFGSRSATRGEAFVFLLRMRDADAHLPGASVTRERKWNYHRKAVETETGLRSGCPFPDFVEELLAGLSPVPVASWGEHEALLRPHRWLGGALASGVSIHGYFAEAAPSLIEVARLQVSWEIWGLLGQVRLRGNYEDVSRHLMNLADLFPPGDPIRETVGKFVIGSMRRTELLAHRKPGRAMPADAAPSIVEDPLQIAQP